MTARLNEEAPPGGDRGGANFLSVANHGVIRDECLLL